MLGYVLVRTAPGKEHDVFKALEKIPQIKEKYGLFGEFDVICKIEANNADDVTEVVVGKIRTIAGVIDTKTFISTSL
ncbi:MAG: Lrp/AsnC ligand binding domain-containing protein [Euryarchaeota archaeon]|jgi:DNA-binding Lrp family transcriptional regulator|nr:Lrp/AsnC ligand binding domain-containing protein [Euryarchaeota archaeon]